MNDTKCQHDACHCTGNEVQSNGYCSESCRRGETADGRCACGHPDCR